MEDIFADDSNSNDSFGWLPLSGKVREETEEPDDAMDKSVSVKQEPDVSDDEETTVHSRGSVLSVLDGGDTSYGSNTLSIKLESSEDRAVLDVDDLLAENEFWLVQCPINVGEEMLRGKSFNAGNQKCSVLQPLNVNEQLNVRLRPASKQISFSCVLPSRDIDGFQLVCLPAAGQMVINESVKENQAVQGTGVPISPVPRNEIRTLPTGLRVRHPLLGVDFREGRKRMKTSHSPKKDPGRA